MIAMLLALAAASAQEADDWWIGLPVVSVGLVSPDGGLPEESLEPLLRVRQGDRVTPDVVRLDLTTLFRVGEFSAVEADAEPFPYIDEQGQITQGVQITYLVHPAPKTTKVSVQGARGLRTRDILEAAAISVGQPFYHDLDGPLVAERVRLLYVKSGYPDAIVEVDIPDASLPGETWIRIAEGTPNMLDSLSFVGDLPDQISERQLRRWARREGVEVGKPFAGDAVREAQARIRRELGRMGGLLQPHRGWTAARLTHVVVRDGDKRGVTFTIEPGQRLDLIVEGLSWRPKAKVRSGMGIDQRLRVTRGFLEEAPERMNRHLQLEGYFDAKTEVALHETPTDATLHVKIDRRAVHTITRYDLRFSDGGDVSLARLGAFEGPEKEEGRKLITVLEQASDDVLRRGYYEEASLQSALDAARSFYQSRGYLDAKVTATGLEAAPKRGLGPLWIFRAITGSPPREIHVSLAVDRGLQTVQKRVAVVDAAPDVSLSYVETFDTVSRDQPYSPQSIELLRRRVIEDHRAMGYLDAEATLNTVVPRERQIESTIVVTPGQQVLLRSVVTQGTQRTRPAFIRRLVHLERGKALASQELERVRRDLYELGTFRSVDLKLLGDESARDLVIAVQERPLMGYELGGGVNTDEGVRVFGRATRRNVLRLAHSIDLYGLVGIEYNDWRNPEWRVAISYAAPRFPFGNQRTTLQLLAREQIQERTWTLGRSGITGQLETVLGRMTLRTAAALEARQLEKVDSGSVLTGEPWYTLVGTGLPTVHRIQESIEATMLYDTRDDPLAPHRGYLLNINTEWSPRAINLASTRDQIQVPYVKGTARFAGYLSLGGATLRISTEGAVAKALNDGVVPLEERYRLGGTGSMRGYQRDAVGPKNLASRVDADWPGAIEPVIDFTLRDEAQRWTPTGGDVRAVGITELILPFGLLPPLQGWDGYAFTFFVDVGNVWFIEPVRDLTEHVDLLPRPDPVLRVGTGVGVRFETPVGPFQLDYGLNPQRAFSRGALRQLLEDEYEEPSGRFHLTLGAQW